MSAHHAHITPEELLGFSLPEPARGGLTVAQTRDVMKSLKTLRIRWELFGPHIAFDPGGYFRKRLYRAHDWEMLILCWLPGHTTVIHDHGGSWGGTAVLSGSIHEQTFSWRGAGKKLVKRLDRTLPAPRLTMETLETIHQVSNRSNEPAVSLHIYSPPLCVLNSYELETGARHAVELEVSPAVAVGGKPGRRKKVA